MKRGDRVQYRPEWRDPNDDETLRPVHIIDEPSKGRCLVRTDIGWGSLNPTSTVGLHMIEPYVEGGSK